MVGERLLAKSWWMDKDYPAAVTLPGHLADVHRATSQVLVATGAEQLLAVGLPPEKHLDRLKQIVLLAAAVHDLGKANDHFQGVVGNDPSRSGKPQGLRHEWVSLLMLQDAALRRWLLPAVRGCEQAWNVMLWSVAGHHRVPPPSCAAAGAGSEIMFLMGCPDFRKCLEWLEELFDLPDEPPKTTTHKRYFAGGGSVFPQIVHWRVEATRQWEENFDEEEQQFLAVVKSCLIAGDVAGSALPRAVKDRREREEWIPKAFANIPPPGRIQAIVDRRRKAHSLFQFQEQIADSRSPVTFARAGCGSGKTLAAYQWAARQYPSRRLYFCYPTTGTATEGFRDYLHAPEEEFDADLFHGRAKEDLELILGVEKDNDDNEPDVVARIESLDAWSTPIVACTVDTVLGLMQNNRRGMFSWPALAGAAFVFDEIHAYDEQLFGTLLRFLDALRGVPVLLMTASLQMGRLHALEETVKRLHGSMPILPAVPLESELWKRYHRQGAVDRRDALAEVHNEVRRGGKVLWVCNTVNRVIAAADHAAQLNPRIYHSRFRYEDRVEGHKEVVAAFDPKEPGPVLACCSQVAEISLDLKGVTLLLTELAPVSAIIQRLGRLNRQASGNTPTRPFIVVEPETAPPYTDEELETARLWLAALGEGRLSQEDLARHWNTIDNGGEISLIEVKWLDGGPLTEVGELRKASPGITVLLPDDAVAVREGRVPLARVVLPMPVPPSPWKIEWRSWPQVMGVPVVPPNAIDYDKKRGAKWRT